MPPKTVILLFLVLWESVRVFPPCVAFTDTFIRNFSSRDPFQHLSNILLYPSHDPHEHVYYTLPCPLICFQLASLLLIANLPRKSHFSCLYLCIVHFPFNTSAICFFLTTSKIIFDHQCIPYFQI